MKKDKGSCSLQSTFHSGGFLHPIPQEVGVIDQVNNQEGLPDPNDEWKSYFNDTGYISQEEVYTPSWSPLEEFRGMPELHNNSRVPRTPKRRTNLRSTKKDKIRRDTFGHILQNPEDDSSQQPESWGILDTPQTGPSVFSEIPLAVWEPYMEDQGYKSQPEGMIIPYQAFQLKEDLTRKRHLEEFARFAGQDFINFAYPEINVISEEIPEGSFDSDLESIASNIPTEIWDTLGQPSGKYDFLVKYSAPASSRINIEDIQPTGWGDLPEYSIPTKDVYIPPQISSSTRKKKVKTYVRTKKKTAGSKSSVNTVTKNNPEQDVPHFIMHNGVRHYWTAVEVPTVVHISK